MAPPTGFARTAASYAVRYGPLVIALAEQARGPAQEAAQRAWDSRRARRAAEEHARTLRQGTVLDVMDVGRRRWVVFSGDEAVTAYPPSDVPLLTLVLHADTERRHPPGERASAFSRLKASRGRS